MIYVQVDFTDATAEEQEAIAGLLDQLRVQGVQISSRGLDDVVEALADKLKGIFSKQSMTAGELLNDVRLVRLLNLGALNPAEKKIAPKAFDLLRDEGVLLEEGKSYRLTEYGEAAIYAAD